MAITIAVLFAFMFASAIILLVVSSYGLARGLKDRHKDFYTAMYTSISFVGVLLSIVMLWIYVAYAPGY